MDTNTINKLFKNYSCFKGVYPSDKLPYDIDPPLRIIANTDPSNKPGTHWVSISINKKGYGQYFDSFGLPPINEDLFKFIERKAPSGWVFNKIALQNTSSNTCGNYCVVFVIFMCEGLTNEHFTSLFSKNTLKNDDIIRSIYKNFSVVKKLANQTK